MTTVHKRPVVVLSYYDSKELPKLVGSVKASGLSPKAPVFVGSYGISAEQSRQVHSLPNGRYAPMFTMGPSSPYFAKRRLSQADEAVIGKKFAGPVPGQAKWAAMSSADRVSWGKELGQRMRDQ